jgi:hypothetical protein
MGTGNVSALERARNSRLQGRGLSAVTVAIDPAPFRGVLVVPLSSLGSGWPVLANPANRGRAVTLTFDHFR